MTSNTQVLLHGVPVVFPFVPYESQREYMSAVIEALMNGGHGLLESPTGTGKTLSMLCAVLGWLRSKKAGDLEKKFPPILYCSRTHSQLAQVVREFKRTVYAEDTTMAVLGSREHLCVHSQVTGLPSTSQGFQCAQLRSDNSCRFFRGTARYMAAESREVAGKSLKNINLHDIEDLRVLARQENFCPYFYEREIAASADIIFLPYTYILDKSLRSQLPFSIEGSIVIFDEAHNVPSALTSAGSHSVSAADLAGSLRDLDHIIGMMEQRIASVSGVDPSLINVPWINERGSVKATDSSASVETSTMPPDEFLGLASAAKLLLAELEKNIDAETIGESGELDHSGKYMIDFLAKGGISAQAFASGKRHLKGVLSTSVHLLSSVSAVTAMVTGSTGQHLSKVLELLGAVFENGLSEKEMDSSCRFVMQAEGSNARGQARTSRTLCFWCLDVSVPMRAVTAPLRQVFLTSGTLSPMSHFAAEIGMEFAVNFTSRHVIDTHQQLRSFVLKTAPDGSTLNGSYSYRSVKAYYSGLGACIINLAVIVPDGMLVFFPSYAAMNAAIAAWKVADSDSESTLWGQLGENKTIFVEPPTTAELQSVITEYQECASRRRGAILFGVARGKISEGVDFADKHARCVIVTGIPFANNSDLFVKIKRRFLTSVSRTRPLVNGKPFTGDDWYKNEALRSVNQCIGRVIRHAKDYGVIVLADERFSQHTDALPRWVTIDGALITASQYRDCFASCAAFFSGRAKLARKELAEASETSRRICVEQQAVASRVTAFSAAKAMEHHKSLTSASSVRNTDDTFVEPSSQMLERPVLATGKFINLFASAKKSQMEVNPMSVSLPEKTETVAASPATVPANGSKTLIADLKTAMPEEAYKSFKQHLESLVALKRAKGSSESVAAIFERIVFLFYEAMPRQKASQMCLNFRPYASPHTILFDSIVQAQDAAAAPPVAGATSLQCTVSN